MDRAVEADARPPPRQLRRDRARPLLPRCPLADVATGEIGLDEIAGHASDARQGSPARKGKNVLTLPRPGTRRAVSRADGRARSASARRAWRRRASGGRRPFARRGTAGRPPLDSYFRRRRGSRRAARRSSARPLALRPPIFPSSLRAASSNRAAPSSSNPSTARPNRLARGPLLACAPEDDAEREKRACASERVAVLVVARHGLLQQGDSIFELAAGGGDEPSAAGDVRKRRRKQREANCSASASHTIEEPKPRPRSSRTRSKASAYSAGPGARVRRTPAEASARAPSASARSARPQTHVADSRARTRPGHGLSAEADGTRSALRHSRQTSSRLPSAPARESPRYAAIQGDRDVVLVPLDPVLEADLVGARGIVGGERPAPAPELDPRRLARRAPGRVNSSSRPCQSPVRAFEGRALLHRSSRSTCALPREARRFASLSKSAAPPRPRQSPAPASANVGVSTSPTMLPSMLNGYERVNSAAGRPPRRSARSSAPAAGIGAPPSKPLPGAGAKASSIRTRASEPRSDSAFAEALPRAPERRGHRVRTPRARRVLRRGTGLPRPPRADRSRSLARASTRRRRAVLLPAASARRRRSSFWSGGVSRNACSASSPPAPTPRVLPRAPRRRRADGRRRCQGHSADSAR